MGRYNQYDPKPYFMRFLSKVVTTMSVQTKATKFGYGVFNVMNYPPNIIEQSIRLGIKERGIRGVCKQLFCMGEIKIGTLKGQDEHGNMYHENLKYQLGIQLTLLFI